jgi:hypothetical protein
MYRTLETNTERKRCHHMLHAVVVFWCLFTVGVSRIKICATLQSVAKRKFEIPPCIFQLYALFRNAVCALLCLPAVFRRPLRSKEECRMCRLYPSVGDLVLMNKPFVGFS